MTAIEALQRIRQFSRDHQYKGPVNDLDSSASYNEVPMFMTEANPYVGMKMFGQEVKPSLGGNYEVAQLLKKFAKERGQDLVQEIITRLWGPDAKP